MNPENIGKSVLLPLTVGLILVALWPFFPTSGLFAQIPEAIGTISDFAISAMVAGALAVAYSLLNNW